MRVWLQPGRCIQWWGWKLRSWLQGLRDVSVTAEGLLGLCQNEGSELVRELTLENRETEGAPLPHALAAELLTFLLYAGCLLEFFVEQRSSDEYAQAYADGRMERLLTPGRHLGFIPGVAGSCLEEISDPRRRPGFPVPAEPFGGLKVQRSGRLTGRYSSRRRLPQVDFLSAEVLEDVAGGTPRALPGGRGDRSWRSVRFC